MKNDYKKLYESLDEQIYKISVNLIKNICNDLNKSSKIEYFNDKYLLKPNTKQKPIKDKNAPKKNKSSYIFFTEELRPKLQKKFPKDTIGDLSKRLGKLWTNLKDNDKTKYEKLASKDKKRYNDELNKYKNLDISDSDSDNSDSDNSNSDNSNSDNSYSF